MSDKKIYQNITLTNLPNSEVEIEGELLPEALSPFYAQALAAIKARTELPGFRKGHVPEHILKERVGELFILEDAAELALQAAYPEIVSEQKLNPIGYPKVAITSIALGAPVKFKASIPLFPQFTLPDYKKIAASISQETPLPASAEEVTKAIDEARRERRHHKFHEEHADASHDGPDHPNTDLPLEELTDEEASQLGKVSSAKELREKVGEMLTKEKERVSLEKRRVAIMDALIEKTGIDLPNIVIESELSRMEQEFIADISRLNISFDEYLKRTNKKREVLIEEWRPRATSRAKLELILSKIAETEKLTPENTEIEKEITHLREHHPKADVNALRSYVTRILTHQKVLDFLEREA